MDIDSAARRRSDPREHLQQGALSRAVPTHDPNRVTLVDLEAHVIERVERLLGLRAPEPLQPGE